MKSPRYFRYLNRRLKLPLFFPDATKGVVRTLDSQDLKKIKIPGVLVNTYHLYSLLGEELGGKFGGIREFMGWQGAVISDSGGFQVMSLARENKDNVKTTDYGITFKLNGQKTTLSPEKSIRFQMSLKTDLIVVLDDFGTPGESYKESKEVVERTLKWAKRSKVEFEKICKEKRIPFKKRPYIIGVVQGGDYEDLRKDCTEKLVEIGFDGLGYGGWTRNKKRMHRVGKLLASWAPNNYLVYGLGVGKPDDIVFCAKNGFHIFDCVIPTRDARHRRLYVYNTTSIDKIDVYKRKFYSYFIPDKKIYKNDTKSVSKACDCALCSNYSRAYLYHLFKINELGAMRLATVHNLRFYSILMEKLQKGF